MLTSHLPGGRATGAGADGAEAWLSPAETAAIDAEEGTDAGEGSAGGAMTGDDAAGAVTVGAAASKL
jgi:hypothetical protein